jgi:hypothetical protein
VEGTPGIGRADSSLTTCKKVTSPILRATPRLQGNSGYTCCIGDEAVGNWAWHPGSRQGLCCGEGNGRTEDQTPSSEANGTSFTISQQKSSNPQPSSRPPLSQSCASPMVLGCNSAERAKTDRLFGPRPPSPRTLSHHGNAYAVGVRNGGRINAGSNIVCDRALHRYASWTSSTS